MMETAKNRYKIKHEIGRGGMAADKQTAVAQSDLSPFVICNTH